MKLLATTGTEAAALTGQNRTIPASSTDYEIPRGADLYASLDEQVQHLLGNAAVTALKAELEAGDGGAWADITDIADATGGGTTTPMALQLMIAGGAKLKGTHKIALQLYDDATLETPAATATADTATKGTILSGGASNSLVVLTDANGEIALTLTDAADETVYVAVGPTTGAGAAPMAYSPAKTAAWSA